MAARHYRPGREPAGLQLCRYRSDASRRTGDDASLHFLRNWQRTLLECDLERRAVADTPRAGETQTKCYDGAVPCRRRLLRDVPVRKGNGTDHARCLRNERRTLAARSRFSAATHCSRAIWGEKPKVADADRTARRSGRASPSAPWLRFLQTTRLGPSWRCDPDPFAFRCAAGRGQSLCGTVYSRQDSRAARNGLQRRPRNLKGGDQYGQRPDVGRSGDLAARYKNFMESLAL